MAAVAPYLAVVSTVAQVAGAMQEGNAAREAGRAAQQAAEFQAKQMEQRAGQERAASQRAAEEQKRRAQLVSSRAQALAAASGAGALDPTVVDMLGDLEGEGQYRALTALYAGEERATGLETGAAAARYEGEIAKRRGDAARRGSLIKAGGTLLSGASKFFGDEGIATMFDRFGGGGPSGSFHYGGSGYGF